MRYKFVLLVMFCFVAHNTLAQKKMPLIGVSSSWGDSDTRVPKAYTNSVMKAGGVAVVLPITSDTAIIEQQVDAIDALVMTGGADLDPMLYGEQPHYALGEVCPERDIYDMALLKTAIKKGKPIFGICRGMQGINVLLGGSLYQDIPSNYGKNYIKHNQQRDAKYGIHTIYIQKGSILHDIVGQDSTVVNSRHHQAINRLADGCEVVARSSDGIIEAIECKDKKIVAVQFHPEDMADGGNEQMLRMFKYLVNQIK